jgi:hypothetical protein
LAASFSSDCFRFSSDSRFAFPSHQLANAPFRQELASCHNLVKYVMLIGYHKTSSCAFAKRTRNNAYKLRGNDLLFGELQLKLHWRSLGCVHCCEQNAVSALWRRRYSIAASIATSFAAERMSRVARPFPSISWPHNRLLATPLPAHGRSVS